MVKDVFTTNASGTPGIVDRPPDDGNEKISYNMKRPYYGFLLVPGIWRDLDDFSSGSVLLCMASEHYDEKDYIRDYEDFVKYKGGKKKK